jgi:hypothetical protein
VIGRKKWRNFDEAHRSSRDLFEGVHSNQVLISKGKVPMFEIDRAEQARLPIGISYHSGPVSQQLGHFQKTKTFMFEIQK